MGSHGIAVVGDFCIVVTQMNEKPAGERFARIHMRLTQWRTLLSSWGMNGNIIICFLFFFSLLVFQLPRGHLDICSLCLHVRFVLMFWIAGWHGCQEVSHMSQHEQHITTMKTKIQNLSYFVKYDTTYLESLCRLHRQKIE